MNNTLGEALKKALNSKNSKRDFSSFVWKGEKVKQGDKFVQVKEQIEDMSPERLKECYKHCEKMLYNNNPKNLGRYNVLTEVTNQLRFCNTELFIRYCENSYLKRDGFDPIPRHKMIHSIRSFMRNSEIDAEEKGITIDWKEISVSHLFSEVPVEFQDVMVSDAYEACMDNLGAFDKQHLTMTFITKMGLWLTKVEENELKSILKPGVDRLVLLRERLKLPVNKIELKFNEKGLSYHEMRAMLILPKKQKYADMTTEQLLTLRNKVLPRFIKEVDNHILSWKRLQRQIEIVAKFKNVNLND